jgi:hypothetical protein
LFRQSGHGDFSCAEQLKSVVWWRSHRCCRWRPVCRSKCARADPVSDRLCRSARKSPFLLVRSDRDQHVITLILASTVIVKSMNRPHEARTMSVNPCRYGTRMATAPCRQPVKPGKPSRPAARKRGSLSIKCGAPSVRSSMGQLL